MIEVEEELEEGCESEEEEKSIEETCRPQVSVSAVTGISDFSTMKVRGTHAKKIMFVLLDSGSTHNFLDVQMAEKLGVHTRTAGLTKVTVADGSKLSVKGMVDQFQWGFQGTTFQSDFMIIPLGGCDMVLGVQWLRTLGDITWNLDKLEMSFWWRN